MEKDTIKFYIPTCKTKELTSFLEKTSKKISGLEWTIGEPYKKTFRHHVEGTASVIKMTHEICEMVLTIPLVNDWKLLATIEEGAIFVSDMRTKLEFKNPNHGATYDVCDVCGHHQRKKSFIVLNEKTGVELQVGSECAKKFGIGLIGKIAAFEHELYESFDLGMSCEDPYNIPMWKSHFKDPYAHESVELSQVVQAAKAYYDKNNGVWLKGRYVDKEYYPSQSAAELKSMLHDYKPNENDAYYLALTKWLEEVLEADTYSSFDDSIKSLATSYYVSKDDVSVVFFAIKKYEAWKKDVENKKNGIYIPKSGHCIKICGKVVDKIKKDGFFGDYYEYTILNNIDGNIYKRSGAVKCDEDNNMEGYAIIKGVWNGDAELHRITKNPPKGYKIENEFLIK